MKMNTELRHKQNVLQAQLRSSVERKADMEADLKEKTKEIECLSTQLDRTGREPVSMHSVSKPPKYSKFRNRHLKASLLSHQSSPLPTAPASLNQSVEEQKDPDKPCFTKKEVRDIIFERNELKTNLFLVQEELSYYQR